MRAVVYPGPAETGNPWTQWGQGIVTTAGHFLSATGDHLGADGNSYLYDYDPAVGELTMIGDVLSLVDHQPGAWGYGKIHAQMISGPCGEVYVTTYWGTRTDLAYGDGYDGDLLLRLDPAARTTTVLGVPVPGHGIPSLAGSPDAGTLYGEATEPTSDPDGGSFFAYDIASGETTIVDDSADHVGFRALAVDADGGALFTMPEGHLTRYDPQSGETERLPDALPGTSLRAATAPAPDGTVYGVTQSPARFIAIRPGGTVEDLGEAPGYIASLAMEPDGSTVYFVPGAHGDAWKENTPLYALDTATGDQRVVVELNPMTEEALGLTAGGTYNLALDAAARRLFVGLNAGPADEREDTTFGDVVLVEVALAPPSAEPGENTGTETTAARATTVIDGGDIQALQCVAFATAERADSGDDGRADGPVWEDATSVSGLEDALVGMMGHAAAWGDLDGDGGSDLFVGTFADRPVEDYAERGADGPAPDAVLRADGEGEWADTETPFELGRTSGAVFADLDVDGDVDLVAARNTTNKSEVPTVILGNDDGRLETVDDSGLDAQSPGRSIGVLDVDVDGLPDLLVLEDRFRGESSRLYRNVGNLRFEPFDGAGWPDDVHGLGVGTGDLNGDGLTDVVVGGSNRVFVGTGDGLREITDAIAPWQFDGDEDDAAGVALGDVDNDGDADVVIGQHFNSTIDGDGGPGGEAPVRLYRNDTGGPGEDPVLVDVTADAGLIGLPTKAPHVALVDLDNDGWVDLLTTASVGDGAAPAVFMNDGEPGAGPSFTPPEGLGDDQYWVTGPTADVDADGRLDVFLVEWDPALPSRLLLNRTPAGNALQIVVDETLGGGPGTVVAAYEPGGAGDPGQLVGRVEISPTQGYSGGVDVVAHLGLGARESVDVVVIPPAPHDSFQLLGVAAGQRLRLPGGC